MVQMGGLGFIHCNMTLEQQVAEAQLVKRHAPGFVVHPFVLKPTDTVQNFEAAQVTQTIKHVHCIDGCSWH